MHRILLAFLLLTLAANLSIAQGRIGAETLSTGARTKTIADDDPNDAFNSTFTVKEIWRLVKSKTDSIPEKLCINYESATLILDVNSVLAYCKRRKKDHSYKLLYKEIFKEHRSTDSVNYTNVAKYFTDRNNTFTPSLVEFIADYFLKLGEVIIVDTNGQAQQAFYITSYETSFSSGVNYHLNDNDSTLFLDVNYIIR